MNRLIDIFTSEESNEISSSVYNIYFSIHDVWFKTKKFKKSDEYKRIIDLVNITNALKTNNSIKDLVLKSSLSENRTILEYKNEESLNESQIQILNDNVIKKGDILKKSVFIVDILLREERNQRIKYIIATLLSIVTLVLSVLGFYFSTKFKEIEILLKMMEK